MTAGLIALEYDNATYEADLRLDPVTGHIARDSGFETPAIISLFTWNRDPSADVRLTGQLYGWWGDQFSDTVIGSKLWTLRRRKNNSDTQQALQTVTRDAFEWMKANNSVKAVDVETERHDLNAIAGKIAITRADGGRWTRVWEVQLDAI